MNQPMTFVFAGKSGSGKGTQANLLIKYLKEHEGTKDCPVLYLETGQRFRQFMEGATYTAKRVKEGISSGKLMPAYLAVWNWANALIEELKGGEHLIVDGTPRTITEAMAFDDALLFYERTNIHIIYLDVPDEVAVGRLLERGRGDDAKDKIARRLAWFPTDVLPAVMYYKGREGYNFIQLDGSPSIEDVHQTIIKKIWSD